MNQEYLKRVHTYLQQEMPAHKNDMSLNGDIIVFNIPENTEFQPYYEVVHQTVQSCMSRIRDRQCDVNFIVKANHQLCDFRIIK